MCSGNYKTLTIVEKSAPEDDLEAAPLKLMDDAEWAQWGVSQALICNFIWKLVGKTEAMPILPPMTVQHLLEKVGNHLDKWPGLLSMWHKIYPRNVDLDLYNFKLLL